MKTPDDYLKQYQKLHDGSAEYMVGGKKVRDTTGRLFDGSNFYEKLWKEFKLFAKDKESFRVLDYGCGKAKHLYQPHLEGKTFHVFFNGACQEYYLYDPGTTKYNIKPASTAQFDAIICADVMEHVLEEQVDDAIAEMKTWLDPKGTAFLSISGDLAKKSFTDGENLHVNVQPLEYWIQKLKQLHRRFVLVYSSSGNETFYKRT